MIRFLHLSDLHYSETYEKGNICFTRMMKKMTSPLEQIKRVFDNREKDYDFVAITGDICEYGTEKEYAFIHDWLEKYFGCPVIGVSGNHEDKEAFRHGFLGLEQLDPLYQEYFFSELRVICLDSSDEKHNDGLISAESCCLLKKSLLNKNIPTVILTHHHLIDGQFDMPPAEFSDEFRNVIRESNILAILNGHTHHVHEGLFEGKKCYTAGSFSFVGEVKEGKLYCYEHACGEEFCYDDGNLTRIIIEDKSEVREIDSFVLCN